MRHGVDIMVLKSTGYLENLYNFYIQHLTELNSVYEILSDEESKKVYLAALKGKLTQRIADFRFAPEPQYFLEGFLPAEGDIAIDGGAYLGETAVEFVKQGAKVYSFEMDVLNYQKCLPVADKYGFTMENFGLSNQEGEEFYNSNGYASHKGFGESIAKFIDLDTYVDRKNLPRVDYIKLDIEGSELDMLHGAAKTISRWKPKMAISAYHRPEDLWTLVAYIKSIRPDYEFKFRDYGSSSCDWEIQKRNILKKFNTERFVPTEWEMVLYCR